MSKSVDKTKNINVRLGAQSKTFVTPRFQLVLPLLSHVVTKNKTEV